MILEHLGFALFAAASAQSTTDAARPLQSEQPAAEANVFVIRDNAQPTLWAASINVDGATVASLGQHSYTALHLQPGSHRLRLRWPMLAAQAGTEIELEVQEGQTYYFAVYGQVPIVIATSTFVSTYGSGGSALLQMKPEMGRTLIASCCTFRQPRPSSH